MKKTFSIVLALAIFLGGILQVRASSISNPPSGGTIGATTQQTSLYYVDGNRSDTYSQNGNILTPYKTFSAAISSAASDTYSVNTFSLVPNNAGYIDGAPDTMPLAVYINGNQATYVAASGVTFPGAFDVYDLTLVGNVTESATSTNSIHQFQNGVISGNVSVAGSGLFSNMALTGTSSILTGLPGSLVNIYGTIILGQVTANGYQTNFNDDFLNTTSSNAVVNSTSGQVIFLGASVIQNSSSGSAIHLENGATSSPNVISNVAIIVNTTSTTSTINCGSAACMVDTVQGLNNLQGTFIAPSGTNWITSYDEKKNILNGLTVGGASTTPGFTLQGTNTAFTTASIGGGSLTAGTCASTTTVLPTGISTTTAAFITTPQVDPGPDFYWETVLIASSSVSTRVCAAGITGTPTAALFNVKIIQ